MSSAFITAFACKCSRYWN